MRIASIGFRAKTARAIAIALAAEASEPAYIARWEIALVDPTSPATAQPHHEVMELPWTEAQSAVRPLECCIEEVATKRLHAMLNELGQKGYRVDGIGIVGSADRNLARIGNSHIRAHAAEGILFRHVLEVSSAAHNIRWRSFPDKTIQLENMKTTLDSIGRAAGRPWRADERAAATAAWLVLSGVPSGS
jgi:hypothetical protein